MAKEKKPRYRKRIPPHKRIPPERGLFTHTARDLYDLIFSYGLGSCWMSNDSIARRLGCCIRSVQYARKQLVKAQVIITARTCPRTWAMWARYHRAVLNCQVLFYPIRQEMDNPYWLLEAQEVGVQSRAPWGAKIAPKLDVYDTTYHIKGRLKAEAAKGGPPTNLSRGSASNSASPSGSTGNRRFRDDSEKTEDFMLELYIRQFIAAGWPRERAIALARQKLIEKEQKSS